MIEINATFFSRHVLDTLISLAKSFPIHFLPETGKDDKPKDPPNKGDQKPSKGPADKSAGKSDAARSESDFWDVLVKLDSLSTTSRKGKSVMRSVRTESVIASSGSSSSAPVENEKGGFKSSPLAQLIGLLAHPVVKRSSVLTDRLLRLLALISLALPEPKNTIKGKVTTDFRRQIAQIEVDESIGLDSSLLVMPTPEPGNFSFKLSCKIYPVLNQPESSITSF